MKHTCLLLALPLFAGVCACSNDDQSGQPVSTKEVRFNVTVPKAPRAATTTASIDHFRIFSFVNTKPFMSNVIANRNQSSWSTSPVMYWPADNSPVNFYCISPMIGEVEDANAVPTPNIKDYENSRGNIDLLYSVNVGATENPVTINFRHALSKLAFNFRRREASASQAPLKIDVKEVSVTEIYTKASFTFPKTTTSQGSSDAGTWHDQRSAAEIDIFSGKTATLTDDYQNLNSSGFEFALPQNLATSRAAFSGAYVKVKCTVFDETSGVQIWPKGADDDYLYFPLNSPGAANTTGQWEAGKAYAYNITVGVPADAGKIEFDVTVDEYPSFEDMYLE